MFSPRNKITESQQMLELFLVYITTTQLPQSHLLYLWQKFWTQKIVPKILYTFYEEAQIKSNYQKSCYGKKYALLETKRNGFNECQVFCPGYGEYVILVMKTQRFKFLQRGSRVDDNFNEVNQSPRPGIQNTATTRKKQVLGNLHDRVLNFQVR